MKQATEQRFFQHVCTPREVRRRSQSADRTHEQARISPHEPKRLLDLGSNPILNHSREPHRIASLGSGHNKDCLRYLPTECHPINSTNLQNRKPVPLCESFLELARADAG